MSGDEHCSVNSNVTSSLSTSLPHLWTNNPSVWFSYIESLFYSKGITNNLSRFHLVVAALPPDVIFDISDILTSPPKDNAYEYLKSEIIRRLSVSDERRLEQLLHSIHLGDRSPSQLLTHMRQVAGSINISDSVMRSIWIQRIPANIRAILASLDDTVPLEALARTADKIASACCPSISSVQQEPIPQPSTSNQLPPEWSAVMDRLISRLDSMETRISAIDRSSHMRRSHSRGRPRSMSNDRSTLCWYHKWYGKNAFKCVPPCEWNTRSSKPTTSENFPGAR